MRYPDSMSLENGRKWIEISVMAAGIKVLGA